MSNYPRLRVALITVNAIAPGPSAADLFLQGRDLDHIDSFAKASPLERLGTPEDIDVTVAFLSEPDCWVNGQMLFMNGGLV